MALVLFHPNNIVHPNDVLAVQVVRTETWRLATLLPATENTELALQWCARRSLIHNSYTCPVCNQLCTLIQYAQGIDGRRWSCRRCGTRKSVRERSFFSRSHLSLQQIVVVLYCWSYDMPQNIRNHFRDNFFSNFLVSIAENYM